MMYDVPGHSPDVEMALYPSLGQFGYIKIGAYVSLIGAYVSLIGAYGA